MIHFPKATKKNERQADFELVPDPKVALAQDISVEASHVKKRNRRKRGQTISFDAQELKSFVTGFRKRKLDRQAHAKKKIAELEKRAKRIKKKERDEQLKIQSGMSKNGKWITSSDSDNDVKEESGYTEIYSTSDFKTTVKVEPLKLSKFDNDDLDDEHT